VLEYSNDSFNKYKYKLWFFLMYRLSVIFFLSSFFVFTCNPTKKSYKNDSLTQESVKNTCSNREAIKLALFKEPFDAIGDLKKIEQIDVDFYHEDLSSYASLRLRIAQSDKGLVDAYFYNIKSKKEIFSGFIPVANPGDQQISHLDPNINLSSGDNYLNLEIFTCFEKSRVSNNFIKNITLIKKEQKIANHVLSFYCVESKVTKVVNNSSSTSNKANRVRQEVQQIYLEKQKMFEQNYDFCITIESGKYEATNRSEQQKLFDLRDAIDFMGCLALAAEMSENYKILEENIAAIKNRERVKKTSLFLAGGCEENQPINTAATAMLNSVDVGQLGTDAIPVSRSLEIDVTASSEEKKGEEQEEQEKADDALSTSPNDESETKDDSSGLNIAWLTGAITAFSSMVALARLAYKESKNLGLLEKTEKLKDALDGKKQSTREDEVSKSTARKQSNLSKSAATNDPDVGKKANIVGNSFQLFGVRSKIRAQKKFLGEEEVFKVESLRELEAKKANSISVDKVIATRKTILVLEMKEAVLKAQIIIDKNKSLSTKEKNKIYELETKKVDGKINDFFGDDASAITKFKQENQAEFERYGLDLEANVDGASGRKFSVKAPENILFSKVNQGVDFLANFKKSRMGRAAGGAGALASAATAIYGVYEIFSGLAADPDNIFLQVEKRIKNYEEKVAAHQKTIQKIIDERIAQDLVTEEDIDNLEVPEL
jgi:hypothetical protein